VAATDYRRRKGDDAKPWHFCANCKQWPREHFEVATGPVRPVCTACRELERRQMCTRADAFV
jgi:hypothetical protein